MLKEDCSLKIEDGGLQREDCRRRIAEKDSREWIAEEELQRQIAEKGLQKKNCRGR